MSVTATTNTKPLATADEGVPPEVLALSRARKRPVLFSIVNEPIDDGLVFAVADELGGRMFDKLDWLIVTWGGSAAAGLMTAKLVREQTKSLSILVPAQAHSAGTAMALAGNEIIFSRTGSLSALDVQLDHTSEDGTVGMESSLAMRDALQEIKELSIDLLRMSLKEIHGLTDLDQPGALKAATDLVGAVLAPITSQVGLETLGDRRRARSIGMAFGDEILSSAGYLDEAGRARVLNELCLGLPTHGYPIRHDHASSLGLNASLATGDTAGALDDLAYLASYDGKFVSLFDYAAPATK